MSTREISWRGQLGLLFCLVGFFIVGISPGVAHADVAGQTRHDGIDTTLAYRAAIGQLGALPPKSVPGPPLPPAKSGPGKPRARCHLRRFRRHHRAFCQHHAASMAFGGYSVIGTGGVGLRARTCPQFVCGVVRVLPEGAALDIACQNWGDTVTGSNGLSSHLWDQLSDGTWVSDFYTTTPNVDAFSPPFSQCGSAPPTGGGSSREQRAVDWARSQLGATGWNGWCDKFVATAYGQDHSGYNTAYDNWLAMPDKHPGDTNVPLGALAFYYNVGSDGRVYGHVMISEGNGLFVSTGPQVFETGLSAYFGQYLGWSYAQSSWGGR